MGGNFVGFPIIKPMRVSADGQRAVFLFDITGHDDTNFGWTAMTFSFVSDDDSATLEFLSLTPTTADLAGWGAVIDNVAVAPEPGLPTLLLGGLLGLAGLRRPKPR